MNYAPMVKIRHDDSALTPCEPLAAFGMPHWDRADRFLRMHTYAYIYLCNIRVHLGFRTTKSYIWSGLFVLRA